jgi:hypothetical protein
VLRTLGQLAAVGLAESKDGRWRRSKTAAVAAEQ